MPTIESTAPVAQSKSAIIAHLVGMGIFALLKGAGEGFPQVVVSWFSIPASKLTALFLGAPIEITSSGDIVLLYRTLEIEVTSACSGLGFFSLCCALFAGFATTAFCRHQWCRDFPVGLLFIFGLTLFANAVRMVCAVQIRQLTSQWLPESYHVAIHMAVGMIVFIPVLLLFWNLLQRIYGRNHTH